MAYLIESSRSGMPLADACNAGLGFDNRKEFDGGRTDLTGTEGNGAAALGARGSSRTARKLRGWTRLERASPADRPSTRARRIFFLFTAGFLYFK